MSTAGSQRSRRDSRSRHRHRDDSYSDASYSDDYSDDSFVSDNVSRTSQARRGKRAGGRTGTKMSNSRPRGRGGGANTRGQPSPRGPPTLDNVTKRMLSARRIKINELHSELDDLRHQFTDLKKENKLLLRQHKISERQLDRYEGQENEMPAVIQRHSEEVRAVREQQKRQKERYQRAVKKLRDKDEELERTRRLLKKMKVLVDDRQLKERDELAQRAAKYEAESDEKGHRVQQLERHTENLTKNHRHELGIERARHKETAQRLEEAQEENRKLQATLREKEKELEINNIYRHRVMRPPHKLNSSLTSVSSSPIPASSGADPQRGRRRKNSVPSTTPRDRAKKFEEKRKEEVRRRKEELDEGYTLYERHPAQKDLSPAGDATTGEITTSEKPSPVASHVRGNPQPNTDDVGEGYVPTFSSLRENKTSDQPPKANQERATVQRERKLEDEFLQKLNADSQPDDTKDQDTADWLSDVERDKRDRAEAERRSREEELRQREAESRARDEREAQRRRAEETLARQQAEEAGRREQEERERKEREEKERREREERERRERAEKERDEQERQAEAERQRLASDQLEQQRRKQKDLLLARMKAIDDKDPPASPPSGSLKRDYKHTEPIQNMHQGRPAYNVSVPSLEKAKRRGGLLTDSDDEDGGYKPTFTGSSKKTKPKRQNGFFTDSPPTTAKPADKSALMDDLFGSPSTPQKKAAASTKRETSSTALFGGGSAIIDSEDPPPRSNAHLLPRRTRQPHTATLAARPTINAVGSFDDDIEEVVL